VEARGPAGEGHLLDEETCRLIAECATDIISIHDESGAYIFASPACEVVLGYSPDELIGVDPYSLSHPEDVPAIVKHDSLNLVDASAPAISYRMRHKDGDYKPVQTTSKTHVTKSGEKRIFCITRDMSELQRLVRDLESANAKLKEMASKDELTGIANRRRFNELLDALLLEAHRGRPFALIVCDIDRFKNLNDAHGHQAGDETIIAVAQLLDSESRAVDTVCRYGGEEFAVLLPGGSLEGALKLAERMRRAIEEMTIPYGTITASFGVCGARPDSDSAETLFSRADAALYAAKANGRNRVERGAAATS
jgi:diguanylate cyclase (GGDEF)-like protein/PAS domain S-box-containing protein